MNKEVFTQEFCKAFTIYQQVELIKQYLKELEIPEPVEPVDPSLYLVSKYENEEFKGEAKWSTTENNDVSLDVSVYDTNNSTYAGYMHVGDYSAYIDNNYWRIGLDNDTLTIATDVKYGSYIRSGISDYSPYNYIDLGVGENTYINIQNDGINIEASGGINFNYTKLSDISLINTEKIDAKDINYFDKTYDFNSLIDNEITFPSLDLRYPVVLTYYDGNMEGDKLTLMLNLYKDTADDGTIPTIFGNFYSNDSISHVDGKEALMHEMDFDSYAIGDVDENFLTISEPKLGKFSSIKIQGIKLTSYAKEFGINHYEF